MRFLEEPESAILKMAGTQLMEYFQGKRKDFSLPLSPKGTEFQKRVWEALRSIPYGQTKSYGEIAAQIGNPKACRAVG
ncbi:MAG: methylated-DNA--[protein]-cysteine S-methyltransferase, partial [Lachnospiraceae bacterium]|nr:methylated-DNA--[protein]-cysteine S-methyltransferase [Lachnospiraceae bacterium]